MNSNLYLVVLCLVCSIGFSKALQCFNCDSRTDKDCLELNGNVTGLLPEDCTVEVVFRGPLAGFQLGVITHYEGPIFPTIEGLEFDCIKTEKTVRRTMHENETNQVTERNVYVTRACSIKSQPNACDRFKNMVSSIPTEELIYCGHCESDSCNFAAPSTVAWSSMCALAVLLVVVKYLV